DPRYPPAWEQLVLDDAQHLLGELVHVVFITESALEDFRSQPGDRIVIAVPLRHVGLGRAPVKDRLQRLDIRPQDIEARVLFSRLRTGRPIAGNNPPASLDKRPLLPLGELELLHPELKDSVRPLPDLIAGLDGAVGENTLHGLLPLANRDRGRTRRGNKANAVLRSAAALEPLQRAGCKRGRRSRADRRRAGALPGLDKAIAHVDSAARIV